MKVFSFYSQKNKLFQNIFYTKIFFFLFLFFMFKQESYVKHKNTRLYIEKIKTKNYLKLKV